jgi:FkbM family methyltransferase
MGFNLIRFMFEPQYRAVKRWKWKNGDETLRFSIPLDDDSLVLDIGAYIGEYALALAKKNNAQIESFEPVPFFAQLCRENTRAYKNVHVHEFGLSNADFEANMAVDGLASSIYRTTEKSITAKFRDICDFIEENDIKEVSLAKINIEGGEYDIIPYLIYKKKIGMFRNLMVQFHLIQEGDINRYNAIRLLLEKTHQLEWRYPFIWELWTLREKDNHPAL